jgi:hypothetical protein
VDIQTELYFDDFLGRSLGLLVCCVLFHVKPTVWRGSRQLSATCHLPPVTPVLLSKNLFGLIRVFREIGGSKKSNLALASWYGFPVYKWLFLL